MTKKNVDKLSDPQQVQDDATRAYKGKPDPNKPKVDPAATPVTELPEGQADAGGMKDVDDNEKANG